MKENMPRTPFSTGLSGSAKETEIRLRNIFSGPKKRPPLPFLILMFSLCIFCGNLVSCQVARADVPAAPDTSASISAPLDASTPEEPAWTPVELDTGLLKYVGQTGDWFYENYFPTEQELALLENLPADQLPREAVEVYYAMRRDYWRDALLPVAYDEGADITVYFVIDPDSLPDVEPLVCVPTWDSEHRGIVLRHGNRAAYFHLYWGGNDHFSSNPLLLADDLDGDDRPEAALVLTDGWGTGAYTESLYIFDLDAMTYTVPDFTQVPLEISASPDGKTARLVSGERELEVDMSELGDRFDGTMSVGNIVSFLLGDGRLFCELDVDFSSDTLGYMARTYFPVVCEDGVYKLGPAELITGDMFAEWQELYERSAS